MTPLFKKLNFKEHKEIFVINPPKSFEAEMKEMSKLTKVSTSFSPSSKIEFILCFVSKQTEIDSFINTALDHLYGDLVLWFCYPKTSSNNYKCDFNRDTGWANLGKLNFETVRMVAIDEDFSALRFRRIEFVKTITRRESYALTEDAKKRTSQKGV
jgi:hypothetical protein